MLFMESPEQAHLGCDERIAIHHLYPSSDAPLRGTLTGTILSLSDSSGDSTNSPLFGAHVVAVSALRGTVLATALTDKSGKYTLGALEPGNYFLLAEPFYAGPQALPSYYSELNASVCPGGPFSRTFLTRNNDGFNLQTIQVQSGEVTAAPDLIIHCDKAGAAFIPGNPLSSDLSDSPILNLEIGNQGEAGVVDGFLNSDNKYYRLLGVSGHLEAHALAYSLYSPIHPTISLLNLGGKVVATQTLDPVYEGDSGFSNRDSALIADDLPSGDYLLKVTEKHLEAKDFPAGTVSLDHTPFVIVAASLNGASPAMASAIPPNARCRGQEDFPDYSSPPGLPPRASTQSSSGGTGFCGSVNRQNEEHPLQPPSSGAMIGWFIPWLLMGLTLRVLIHLHAESQPANLKE